MSRLFRISRVFRVLPALLAPLAAVILAAPLSAEPEAPRIVSLDFCCLRYTGGIRTLWLKKAPDEAPAEVAFYQGGFTEPVPVLVENGKVVVYKPGSGDAAAWVPAWSFAVPAAGTDHSAILLPMPPKNDPAAPYTAFVLPPWKDFPGGSVLTVNLTALETGLELGTKKTTVAPGGTKTTSLESEIDSFNMVPVTASILTNGAWHTLHATRWAWHPRSRQVSIIWMDPSAKMPEITSIRQVRPVPETEP